MTREDAKAKMFDVLGGDMQEESEHFLVERFLDHAPEMADILKAYTNSFSYPACDDTYQTPLVPASE